MTTATAIAGMLLRDAPDELKPRATLSEMLDQLVGQIERGEPIIETLPCGFTLLDRAVGGLIRGEFVGIIALPGIGKSTLADKLVLGSVRSRPSLRALVFALETAKKVRVARLIAGESVVPEENGEFHGGALLGPMLRGESPTEVRDRAKQAVVRMKTQRSGTVEFIEDKSAVSHICQIIRNERPDVVEIDHLGLVTLDYPSENDTSRIDTALGEIVRALQETNAAGLIINEVTKQATKAGRIDLAASRGSARFASLASVLVGLTSTPPGPGEDPVITATILKNRHGSMHLQQQAEFWGEVAYFNWAEVTSKENNSDAANREAEISEIRAPEGDPAEEQQD